MGDIISFVKRIKTAALIESRVKTWDGVGDEISFVKRTKTAALLESSLPVRKFFEGENQDLEWRER